MAEWLLVSLLSVCPLVVAEETAVYWERVREFLRLLLRGSLMMPLRFLRSITGESCLQLLRSRSSVRPPSDSPLDMVQSVRAWVGGEGGKGAGVNEEGEQRPFLGPFCAPVRVLPHLDGLISQPTTDRPQSLLPSLQLSPHPRSSMGHLETLHKERREGCKLLINIQYTVKMLIHSRETFYIFVSCRVLDKCKI